MVSKILYVILYRPGRSGKDFIYSHKYKDTTKSYPILFEHLKYTAEMVIESLSFENDQALGWSTDMLIRIGEIEL